MKDWKDRLGVIGSGVLGVLLIGGVLLCFGFAAYVFIDFLAGTPDIGIPIRVVE